MKIHAIALGKKQMGFLDYEAVITPGSQMNTLSSVNIVRQGKILVKIKTDLLLDQYNTINLEQIIEHLIIDYIIGRETGSDKSPSVSYKTKSTKPSRKQSKARTKAANDLFTMFNI